MNFQPFHAAHEIEKGKKIQCALEKLKSLKLPFSNNAFMGCSFSTGGSYIEAHPAICPIELRKLNSELDELIRVEEDKLLRPRHEAVVIYLGMK